MFCLRRFFCFSILGLLCLLGSAAAQDEERIRSYDSYITVNPDNSMQVRETIDVVAAGIKIKHGIYRDFPTRYRDHFNNRYTVEFDVVSVERDGQAEPWHISSISDGVRVYFGSSTELVSEGPHRYVFTYRTNRQLGFFKDHDELYWNVTGTKWDFPIDVATATVVLPPPVRRAVTSLDGYTGYAGDKGKAFTASRDDEGNPVFRAENLLPNQGLTIVVTWPKGLVTPPTQQQQFSWFVNDNKGILIGAGGLVVLWFYYLVVWVMVGRDPAAGTIVPLYEPPDNMSPPAMRFLKHMHFDDKGFSVGILGLAARGYLNIEQRESGKYRLVRKAGYGKVETHLSPDEKLLTSRLFEIDDQIDLDQINSSRISEARKTLNVALHKQMEKVDFKNNAGYLIPGLALSILAAVGLLVNGQGEAAAGGIFIMIWLSGWSVGTFALLNSVRRAWQGVKAGGVPAAAGALFITLFSIPFVCGEIFGLVMLTFFASVPAFLVIVCLLATNVLFHHLLRAPTRVGRLLLDRVDGFKMFLTAVDVPRLQAMAPPPGKTPELFERFLPYAVALGVEQAWADQFSQVLAAAAGGGAQGAKGYSPSWYSGGFMASSPTAFASSFAGAFSSACSSAATPPGSSSGGGGGSSGGGGGGGGGGGW
jgi:uncharacterized membrane protein YgcG